MGLCSQADVQTYTPKNMAKSQPKRMAILIVGVMRLRWASFGPVWNAVNRYLGFVAVFKRWPWRWGQPCILKSVTYQGGITTACRLTARWRKNLPCAMW